MTKSSSLLIILEILRPTVIYAAKTRVHSSVIEGWGNKLPESILGEEDR